MSRFLSFSFQENSFQFFTRPIINLPSEPNENYFAHGEKVVDFFQNKATENGGLVELEQMWRTHFLDVMRPRHMPELWSIEHSGNRLEIRVDENRITEDELQQCGWRRPTAKNVDSTV